MCGACAGACCWSVVLSRYSIMACMGDCAPLSFMCSLGGRWVYVRRCVYVHMYTCVCEHVPVCVHTDVSYCCVDLLNQNAGYFQKTATNLKRKLWWQNVKVCTCACSIVQCDVSILFHFRSILHSYATDKDVFATGNFVGTGQPKRATCPCNVCND